MARLFGELRRTGRVPLMSPLHSVPTGAQEADRSTDPDTWSLPWLQVPDTPTFDTVGHRGSIVQGLH